MFLAGIKHFHRVESIREVFFIQIPPGDVKFRDIFPKMKNVVHAYSENVVHAYSARVLCTLTGVRSSKCVTVVNFRGEVLKVCNCRQFQAGRRLPHRLAAAAP